MRARRAKKPSSSIRYLLLADRRLRRISLKRISARLRKAKQPSRSKNSASARTSKRRSRPSSAAMAILLAVCLVAAAAFITADQPSYQTEVASASALPLEIGREGNTRPMTPRVDTKKTAVPKAAATMTVPAKPSARENTTTKVPPAESPKLPTVSNVQALAPVTITGCLEIDKGTFRLKNTSGVDAPKSRSWKSGFLKKRSSQIEVVDEARTLRLPTYVGQRVVATGTLADGEMRARSLKRVAASCN